MFFGWLFGRFVLYDVFLSDSDLYEYFLPQFLAPVRLWSSFEFSGLPAFADPGVLTFYVPNILLGGILHSWTAFVLSACVLAACFSYAYVYSLTKSCAAATFSALAYSASEAMVERLAHLTSVHVIAWLPLMALAVDRVRGPDARLWVVVGGAAVACCVLAGHPQPAIYAVYCAAAYAVAGLVAERARWRAYAATAAMFGLGASMAAVKLLPLADASLYLARQQITFERFVGRSLTAGQTWSIAFPTVLHGDTRELPTYVGIATLLLAIVALTRMRSNWRIAFWGVVGVIALLMAMGTATPLVDAASHVPLYGRFRNLSRHLFLFAFGAAVLGGLGLASIERRDITRAALRRASLILLVPMTVGGILMASRSGWFEFEVALGRPGPGPMAALSIGIWIQFLIACVAVALASWMVRRGPSPAAITLLVALLGVDLVNALPYEISRLGAEFTWLRAANTGPSVHAATLRDALEPAHQRALAIGGTGTDEVVPAGFAAVWRLPIAGGYGPMLLERYSEFAQMGTNGEVRPAVLSDTDVALDLLAVRYIIVNRDVLDGAETQRWLKNGDRWREVTHVRTSRTTDRGADIDVENEQDVAVFENERALPRAWFADDVVGLSDADALAAVRTSRLPDGRAFDPRGMAIAEPAAASTRAGATQGAAPQRLEGGSGDRTVRLTRIGDGDIELAVSGSRGGFLVLSENFYPGWRARIDGGEVTVLRTDVTLMGIDVPAGDHTVAFSLEPGALRAGSAISLAALLACVGLLARLTGGARPRRAPPPARRWPGRP